jgi:DNA-binding NarL/FixJ family response regulator
MVAFNPIRILCIDDHHLLREGIATIINSQPDMQLVSQAATGTEGIRQYRQHQPDITLMDLRLPDLSGIDTMLSIRAEFANARIIILTMFDGHVEVQRALRAGACGYFHKTMPPGELVGAMRHVHAGKRQVQPELASQLAEHMGDDELTVREIEVLEQVAAGRRNRDIGERLFISEETVKVHLKHIMEKLGARDRTHAVTIADRRGIIRVDGGSRRLAVSSGGLASSSMGNGRTSN